MASSNWDADVESRKWIQGMNTFAKNDHPLIVAESLNAPASAIERQARKNVEKRLIVRTSYTLNSIKHDRQARGNNIDRMFSQVRTNSLYLKIQDKGGIIKSEGKRLAIPLASSRTGQNIRKRIASRYKMNTLGDLHNSPLYFMGRPRGGRGKSGIYQRIRGNKLKILRRTTTNNVRVPASYWWLDSIKQYGTPQFIKAQYLRLAKTRLKRFMR